MHQKTRQYLFIIAFCSFGTLTLAVFVYGMTSRSIGRGHERALVLFEKRLASQEAVSLQHLISDTAEERADLDRAFIGREGVVEFIELLESLGRNTGVALELTTVGAGKATEEAGLEQLVLRFFAVGSFQGVTRFFSLVEALPYVFTLETMGMGRHNEGMWRLTVGMSVYKLR